MPDGPAMARFSARPIHSRVASAFWVASGMEDSSGRQEANVLPAGKLGGLAAHPPGGGVAAGDFLGEQDAQDLGGLPPLGAGGGEHVGGGFAQVGQPHPAQQGVELGRERRCRGAGHRALLAGVVSRDVDGQAEVAARAPGSGWRPSAALEQLRPAA